ncbi:MAG TPA: rod shape-determining protein RodA [Candidatus Binatia bacterium]|nr:rod shape-determining protein RodA [Candidatus Binatia bacterium]
MSSTALPRPPDTGVGDWLAKAHLDLWLTLLIAAVCAVGLLVLYSASGHSIDMVWSQAQRMVFGAVVMVLCAHAPPEVYRALAPWFYAITIVLLLLVFFLGDESKGARRWLNLGVVRFQPSELMKLGMPLAVAAFLHGRYLPPRFTTVLVTLGVIGLPTALIAKQPDLGTALVVVCAGGFALYFSGWGWRWLATIVAAVGAATPVAWHYLHEYQRQRVLTFLSPERDPLGAGYHITQSKIAIGSGGLFGKGWMQGTQAHLDFLPESHTDFIFAVYAEEFGLLGVTLLLALYLAIVGRGLTIALRGQDTFQRLLGGALSLTFFLYVFINIGMVIGLLPVVGVPLPLISYGGTSMVSLLAGFGMLMSIHTHRKLISN